MNSDRYLLAFNKIEENLRKVSGRTDRSAYTFAAALHEAAARKNEVRRFKDELLEFAELRNAIVHQRTKPEYVIAEPHDSVVARIEYICEVVSNPIKVLPKFQREVMVFQTDDPVARPLELLREKNISQFPVYQSGRLIGLLSERCIARWLAHSEIGLVSLEDTPVLEVLRYEETGGENYKLIARTENVYDAIERFSQGPRGKAPFLDALLITHSGKPDEALLGIITAWDILGLHESSGAER